MRELQNLENLPEISFDKCPDQCLTCKYKHQDIFFDVCLAKQFTTTINNKKIKYYKQIIETYIENCPHYKKQFKIKDLFKHEKNTKN
jgi:hypothetical protein